METRFAIEQLFATRTSAVPAPFLSANATAPSESIRFGGGIPDPVTFPLEAFSSLFPRALAADNFAAFNYGGTAGYDPLRDSLVAHLGKRDSVTLSRDQISLVNGISGGIATVAAAFIDPGDIVIAEDASFHGSLFSMRLAGARVVPTPIDDGGLVIDELDALVTRLTAAGERVKLVYTITNFQNPTGSTLNLERRTALARLAERHHLVLVQDDAYGDIRFVDNVPPSLLALAPENAVEVGTFSKTIAPGLRLGWLASSPAISSMLTRVRTDMGTTPMIQRLAGLFMSEGLFEPHVADVNRLYERKRDATLHGLDEYCAPFATWSKPEGGFFVWVTLNDGDASQLARLAPEYGVTINPGRMFHVGEPDPRTFRLSYSFLPEPEIVEGTKRIGAAMRRFYGS